MDVMGALEAIVVDFWIGSLEENNFSAPQPWNNMTTNSTKVNLNTLGGDLNWGRLDATESGTLNK